MRSERVRKWDDREKERIGEETMRIVEQVEEEGNSLGVFLTCALHANIP